ncbi:MAG TPA: cytochrome c oxidase subunit II, partial [Longimicrobiales bacterium]
NNTFWWTMLVLAVVWGVLLVIIFRFREKPGAPPPQHIHGHTTLEILWTIGPALIVAFIAVPTIRTIFQTQATAPKDALVVEVIGHQWWWEFRYPQYGGIATANEVHLIQGRPVDFVEHSADVIHSFWIPRLGGKRDVNPQPAMRDPNAPKRVNHIVLTPDSTGVFPGQCAEYCGDSHAIMRTRAVVQSNADFNAWLQAYNTPPAPPPGSLAAQGKQILETHACIACHTINGTNARGVIGPNLTLVGSRQTIGAGVLPTSVASFQEWITQPQGVKPGAMMPGIHEGAAGMPPTGLTDQQVQAVAEYLASLKPAAAGATPSLTQPAGATSGTPVPAPPGAQPAPQGTPAPAGAAPASTSSPTTSGRMR